MTWIPKVFLLVTAIVACAFVVLGGWLALGAWFFALAFGFVAGVWTQVEFGHGELKEDA